MFYVEHHLFSSIDHFSDTTLPIENGQIQIVNWKLVEMLEEEKTILISIYLCLSNVHTTMRMIKKIPGYDYKMINLLDDQLQRMLGAGRN